METVALCMNPRSGFAPCGHGGKLQLCRNTKRETAMAGIENAIAHREIGFMSCISYGCSGTPSEVERQELRWNLQQSRTNWQLFVVRRNMWFG